LVFCAKKNLATLVSVAARLKRSLRISAAKIYGRFMSTKTKTDRSCHLRPSALQDMSADYGIIACQGDQISLIRNCRKCSPTQSVPKLMDNIYHEKEAKKFGLLLHFS
jgi:hypothetical protein